MLTAKCMAEQGLPYTPSPSVVVTGDVNIEQVAQQSENANDIYVRSLSSAERENYFLALYGVVDPYDQAISATTGQGCAELAFSRIPGVFSLSRDLAPELEDLERTIRADPAVRAADQAWSACMARGGVRYDNPAGLLAAQGLEEGSRTVNANVATATKRDATCRPAWNQAVAKVRIRHENAFVVRHQADFDAHVAMLTSTEPMLVQLLGQ